MKSLKHRGTEDTEQEERTPEIMSLHFLCALCASVFQTLFIRRVLL